MQKSFSAIIFEEDGWQIAQCLEIDIASQGNTPEEAFENLQEAMRLQLQFPTSTSCSAFASSPEEALLIFPGATIMRWGFELSQEKANRKQKTEVDFE